MKVTTAALALLQTGFQSSFRGGLAQAPTQFQRVSTIIPSSNKSETYGWLGKLPNVREWIGDRVIQNLKDHSYQVLNKDWELTIGVDRNDIEDDAVGQYSALFQEMGYSTGAHSDQLVFALLAAGFATDCYDGQFFFDTDHPVIAADGTFDATIGCPKLAEACHRLFDNMVNFRGYPRIPGNDRAMLQVDPDDEYGNDGSSLFGDPDDSASPETVANPAATNGGFFGEHLGGDE